MSFGQIEVYSHGSTHTLYEFCGFDACRDVILSRGFEIQSDVFERDEFWLDEGEVKITVVGRLDESDRCVWCFGCGDFLRHANASLEPDGSYAGCECAERGHDPTKDREPMRPLVVETGKLELRPFEGMHF
jgi:hypothetical protein